MRLLIQALLALAPCALAVVQAQPPPSQADEREQKLERRIEELAQELQAMRAELQDLKGENQAAAAAHAAAAPQPVQATTTDAPRASALESRSASTPGSYSPGTCCTRLVATHFAPQYRSGTGAWAWWP